MPTIIRKFVLLVNLKSQIRALTKIIFLKIFLLREQRIQKNIPWKVVIIETGISKQTIAKINKNEYVSLQTLERLAVYFDCQIGDLVEIING